MTEVVVAQVTPEMTHNWGWFCALGVVLLLLGIAAVVRSFAATVVSMVFFGWLLVFSGLIEFVNAFMVGHWAGFFLHMFAAVLFIITGLLLATKPLVSAEVATFVMSIFFLVSGLYQLIGSLWTHLPGWGWQAASGIITSILGGLLLAQWPVSGLWAIGLFVGIDLLLAGWSWVMLSLDLRKM